jgi:hypothetical protein
VGQNLLQQGRLLLVVAADVEREAGLAVAQVVVEAGEAGGVRELAEVVLDLE